MGAQDEEWIAYKRERAECKNTSSRSAVRLKREEVSPLCEAMSSFVSSNSFRAACLVRTGYYRCHEVSHSGDDYQH